MLLSPLTKRNWTPYGQQKFNGKENINVRDNNDQVPIRPPLPEEYRKKISLNHEAINGEQYSTSCNSRSERAEERSKISAADVSDYSSGGSQIHKNNNVNNNNNSSNINNNNSQTSVAYNNRYDIGANNGELDNEDRSPRSPQKLLAPVSYSSDDEGKE